MKLFSKNNVILSEEIKNLILQNYVVKSLTLTFDSIIDKNDFDLDNLFIEYGYRVYFFKYNCMFYNNKLTLVCLPFNNRYKANNYYYIGVDYEIQNPNIIYNIIDVEADLEQIPKKLNIAFSWNCPPTALYNSYHIKSSYILSDYFHRLDELLLFLNIDDINLFIKDVQHRFGEKNNQKIIIQTDERDENTYLNIVHEY